MAKSAPIRSLLLYAVGALILVGAGWLHLRAEITAGDSGFNVIANGGAGCGHLYGCSMNRRDAPISGRTRRGHEHQTADGQSEQPRLDG